MTAVNIRQGEIKNALIVGAGKAGEMLVRDLLRELTGPYHPVAFVDDDSQQSWQGNPWYSRRRKL